MGTEAGDFQEQLIGYVGHSIARILIDWQKADNRQ
jgi:hypothetical protein